MGTSLWWWVNLKSACAHAVNMRGSADDRMQRKSLCGRVMDPPPLAMKAKPHHRLCGRCLQMYERALWRT